jgi:activator of HSP90 ATPase
MSELENRATPGNTTLDKTSMAVNLKATTLTRRQAIAGAVIAFASVTVSAAVWARAQQPAMKEAPSRPENQARTTIHEEVAFEASPQRIYEALVDSKQFAAFSGMPAEIDAKAGGAFSMFGGMIVGRNVELVPKVRVVQAWRPTHWDPGAYSIVKFELKEKGAGSTLVLDHRGFPEGEFDSLEAGWKAHYFERLKKYLT